MDENDKCSQKWKINVLSHFKKSYCNLWDSITRNPIMTMGILEIAKSL